MYNKIKICENKDCEFKKKYDTKQDRYNVASWNCCPICAGELIEKDYSPDL